jgi:hypothetical protein
MADTGLLRQPVEGALFLGQYLIEPRHNHNSEVIFTTSKICCRLEVYSALEVQILFFVSLRLTLSMRHHRPRLILLSRIYGDAPRA